MCFLLRAAVFLIGTAGTVAPDATFGQAVEAAPPAQETGPVAPTDDPAGGSEMNSSTGPSTASRTSSDQLCSVNVWFGMRPPRARDWRLIARLRHIEARISVLLLGDAQAATIGGRIGIGDGYSVLNA